MKNQVEICIVEDNLELLDSLSLMIESDQHFKLVGTYQSGESAFDGITNLKPAAVLMDINLPGISGIECIAKIKFSYPDILFLMVSSYEDSDKIFESLKVGASGYILKTEGVKKILIALKEMLDGGSPMSATIARKVVSSFANYKTKQSATIELTEREMEVLDFVAQGLLNKEVAYKMDISVGTVRKHIQHIYEKLHCNTRVEAVNLYLSR